MKPSRIPSIVFSILALAATESALAYCPVPLTSDSKCCYYAGPNGTTENRYAASLSGCLSDVRRTNNLLISSQNPSCFVYTNPFSSPPVSFPASIIDVQERIDSPVAPTSSGGEWHQNFRHTYIASTTITNLNPPVVYTYQCADYSGHLNWVTPPPPPPTVACTIPDFPALPATVDTCTASLEKNNGLPGTGSGCPAVPVMTRALGEPCFREKVGTIGVAYGGPTSTIRTTIYNHHLTTVWDWYWKHQWLITNPVQYEACTAKRAVVEAEMKKHGLTYRPAPNSRHLAGRAFDASPTVIAGIGQSGVFVPSLLRRTTACTLAWGGNYDEPDPVHFELNVP